MWLPVGLLSYCVSVLLRQDGSGTIGSLPVLSLNNPRLYVRVLKQQQRNLSSRNVASARNKNVLKATNGRLKKSSVSRILAVALLLPILAGCYSFKSKRPTETSVKPKLFQCLDKAMEECQGVRPRESIKDAADISAIASEALTKLTACRDKHHELLNCVVDFKGSPNKAK